MATVFGTNAASPLAARSDRAGPVKDLPVAARGPINQLIQSEIIPRLLSAHPAQGQARKACRGQAIDPECVERFASLPLILEADELMAVIEGFLEDGIAAETLFVDLLAPSARRLGKFWEDDACDFVDVTMGLWRLQEVMREITLRQPPHSGQREIRPSALFAPMPGEQHSFGALMIEEVFARADWRTEVLIEPQRRDLLDTIASRRFDLVGLTVSCDCPSDTLAGLVTAIRSVSKCPTIQVFIGGRVVNANPGLVVEVGADGTAPDARSALALAERKVGDAKRLNIPVP